jgi:hypothetical protein
VRRFARRAPLQASGSDFVNAAAESHTALDQAGGVIDVLYAAFFDVATVSRPSSGGACRRDGQRGHHRLRPPVPGFLLANLTMVVAMSWIRQRRSPLRLDKWFRRWRWVSAGQYSQGQSAQRRADDRRHQRDAVDRVGLGGRLGAFAAGGGSTHRAAC